ncbi:MAG: acetyl-CoA carboxylase biotin carboxylase subunit, partial [Planctomycetia bacterium]
KIERLIIPGGFGVRFDSHVHSGYEVSPFYDSMIGKLIVHQPTREEAIACMKRALSEFRVDGLKTTIPLSLKILEHPSFVEGNVDTTFIERTWMK